MWRIVHVAHRQMRSLYLRDRVAELLIGVLGPEDDVLVDRFNTAVFVFLLHDLNQRPVLVRLLPRRRAARPVGILGNLPLDLDHRLSRSNSRIAQRGRGASGCPRWRFSVWKTAFVASLSLPAMPRPTRRRVSVSIMVARQTSPGGSDPQESAVSSFFGAFLPSVLLLFVVFPDIGPEPVQLSSINLIFAHQGMFDLFGMLGRLPQPVPDGRFLVAFHPRETRQAHSLCHKSERFDNFVFPIISSFGVRLPEKTVPVVSEKVFPQVLQR